MNSATPLGSNATDTAVDCNMLQAGGSVMHVASGVDVSGGWRQLVDNYRKRLAELTTAGLGS